MNEYLEYKEYSNRQYALRKIFERYADRARLKQLVFEIDYKTAVELFKGNCHYCDSGPSNILKFNGKVIGKYQGIDRVDNTKGYIPGNIVSCCKYCNSFKSNRTKEDFISHVSKLYRHLLDKI